jgi:hypothetical protein
MLPHPIAARVRIVILAGWNNDVQLAVGHAERAVADQIVLAPEAV